MDKIILWLRQPTTIHGLGALAFAVGAALSQLSFHNQDISLLVGIVAYALTHLGINDNSAVSADTKNLVNDVISMLITKKLAEKVPELLGDGTKVLHDLTQTVTGETHG